MTTKVEGEGSLHMRQVWQASVVWRVLVQIHVQGKVVRESTKQANDKVARQMEAAHRTSLAKGEVGIREKKPVATLSDFLKKDFIPYVEAKHVAKPGTVEYYRDGAKMVLKCDWAGEKLDQISDQNAQRFSAKYAKLSASRINCGLRSLRRALNLPMSGASLNALRRSH